MRDLALLSGSSQSIGKVKPTIRMLFLSDMMVGRRQVSGALGESGQEGSPKKMVITLERVLKEMELHPATQTVKRNPICRSMEVFWCGLNKRGVCLHVRACVHLVP